uniref:BURP domain-containing protein n=1 Tax=Oryza glumipatula TaxID=40148 RepID=A0A0D9ZVR5_9ORYZ
MARSLAALLLLLVAAAGASHAASPAEMYWKIALPTSPMPGAIRDLVNPASSAASVFFLEKDLFPGTKMTIHFTHATAGAALLSRGRADSVPFASEKLPEILSQLFIPAGSPTADAMRSTLAECEAARIAGETTKHEHYCATSLESMVEFVASSLGTRDVHAVSTEVISTLTPTPRQAYRVEAVRPVPVPGGDMVACHRMPYAYAVFGLHGLKGAAYTVTLAGTDGTMAEAVAACHGDLDGHGVAVAEAYERLGVAPGSVAVCHFLPQDDMLWVRN